VELSARVDVRSTLISKELKQKTLLTAILAIWES